MSASPPIRRDPGSQSREGEDDGKQISGVSPSLDRRPRRILGRTGQAGRLAQALRKSARLCQTALRQVVRRRRDQPLSQRRRPAPQGPRQSAGADLHLDRDRRAEDLHLCRAPRRSAAHGRRPAKPRRRQGRPRADLHADDRRSAVRHAGHGAHRRHPLGGVRRLRRQLARHPHRRRPAQGDGHGRCRHARRQGGALQASGRRVAAPGGRAAAEGADRQSRPRQGNARRAGPRRRLRHAARPAPERPGAVHLRRVLASVLHPVHLRHHRQAEGRAARHRRLLRGPGRLDAPRLPVQPGRDLLRHLRHRLGGRPFLHRLRPAHQRHGHDGVRGHADAPRRRHLVEDRRRSTRSR
jgi:hypothetical protein